MSEFHFLRPEWLLALVPLGLILLKLVRRNTGYTAWKDIVDPHLLKGLLKPVKQSNSNQPRIVLAVAWLLTVVALAGPTWERIPPIKFQPDVPPLVLVLDLSRSMEARDLHPSRLEVAKTRLRSLLQQLPPRPVGLVVYSEQAHTAMPLTRDKKLIIRVLGEVTPDMMPAQGSNASDGLRHAAALLTQTGARRGDILLITDGADNSVISTVKQLTDTGYQISVLAVGTLAGSKIPDVEGRGYLIDKRGLVQVAVNEATLRLIAESGGGSYARSNNSGDDVRSILNGFGKARHGATEGKSGQGEVWREHGPLFLLLILPLALLAFRRGAIAALLICITLPSPPVEAAGWDTIWWNGDQRGLRAMREGKPMEAIGAFTDPFWRGVAEYRSSDFQAALKSFSRINTAQAHYNRGNTLMHLGRTQDAIKAYKQVLKLEPNHADASFNLKLIQSRIKPVEPPQEQPETADKPSTQPEQPKAPDKKESLYAEDLLNTPNPEDLLQESGEAPKDLDKIGSLGGGAMLIPGAEQPEGPESPGIGQGLDDGKGAKRESDRIARESRQAGDDKEGSESTTDIAENRFADPSRPKAEGDDAESTSETPDRSSVAMSKSEEGPSPKTERGQDEEQNEAEQNSASLASPDLPAGSAPAGNMDEENMQAIRQWLNRISESQSGLLKEKFLREYRRHPKQRYGGDPW